MTDTEDLLNRALHGAARTLPIQSKTTQKNLVWAKLDGQYYQEGCTFIQHLYLFIWP